MMLESVRGLVDLDDEEENKHHKGIHEHGPTLMAPLRCTWMILDVFGVSWSVCACLEKGCLPLLKAWILAMCSRSFRSQFPLQRKC